MDLLEGVERQPVRQLQQRRLEAAGVVRPGLFQHRVRPVVRQGQRYAGALAHFAVQQQLAAMALGDLPRQRQTQAQTVGGLVNALGQRVD